MNSEEKQISYTSTNSYSTLNKLTDTTENVWVVCHGLGYLSRYFIRYFKELDPGKNYIISPQAPSKYYQGKDFKHVGASWLTKEATLQETENILNYLDGIYEREGPFPGKKLILMGYSQGVSIITRWAAQRNIYCNQLILHSGGIPKELTKDNFKTFTTTTKTTMIYGNDDQFLTKDRIAKEKQRAKELFGSNLNIKPFEGKHEVNTEILNHLANFES